MTSFSLRPRPAASYVDDSAHRVRRNNFDLLAPVYDELAGLVLGPAAKNAQTELLPQLRGARNALVLGGGTGWFLEALLAETGVERVLYIEKSQAMLDRSRALLAAAAPAWLPRVEFRLGTEDSLQPSDGTFELVITNFFLDQFNDHSCAQVIEKLAAALDDEGRWLFVDIHTPEAGWERVAAKVLYKLMYSVLAVTSHVEARRPPHYQATFDRLRLHAVHEETFHGTLIRAKVLSKTNMY
jgi:tRNA (cmo5U34)-methyltransferase